MKHTKGKWEVSRKSEVQVDPSRPLRTETICQIFGNDDEAKANDRLISKAPEMLEALKEAGRLISCGKCESGLRVIDSILKVLR